jgi:hypothetical protein
MATLADVESAFLQADKAGDTASAAVLAAEVRRLRAEQKQPAPQVSQQVGAGLLDIPRQLGLTARAGVKAVAALPAMASDAVTGVYNAAADAIQGKGGGFRFQQAMPALEAAMSRMGVPEPRNADERVIGDAATMVAGAGGLARGAGALAQGATGTARNVLTQLAARPGMQAAGAAGAGLAGGSVREAGGGPVEQFAASLAGGVAGGMAANKMVGAANAIKSALTPTSARMQDADVQINLILQRSGIDWAQVPERIKQGMRTEVAAALNTGQPLNADAVRRLLVFRNTGTTPTVGQLTQDPGLITRERNLAKTAANSTDLGLQQLPALENANVTRLLAQLDDAGAGRGVDLMRGGSSQVDSLRALQAGREANINNLYSAARDTQGRSLPLEGGTFTRRVTELLDEAMAGGALPKDVQNRLNQIALGEYPLTVASSEDLKRVIGRLQRGSSDGSTRYALGLVRQALDEAPLQNSARVNPGNLPAVPGTVPPSVAAGEESIAAFNQARAANREWMQLVERNPGLQAVVDGIEPDQFMRRFVIGNGASAADVRRLAGLLDPSAVQTTRAALARYLRDAATGGDSDVVKFGGKTYRDAFRAIEAKLPAFFDEQEIARFRDIGDAAKYMQAQPAGSAVNNSSSGALVLGRGLDLLDKLAGYVPLGGRDIIRGQISGMQQRQVLNPRNALIELAPPTQQQQALTANPLLAGSLVVTPAQGSENQRRDKPTK